MDILLLFSYLKVSSLYKKNDVIQLANQVFDDKQLADRWLNEPLPILQGKSPSMLLCYQSGCQIVLEILRKIQSGEFV